MREIKFRAVIKETNKVFTVDTIWSNSVCLDLTDGVDEYNSKVYRKQEVQLLQYTGLKDSNRDGDFPEGIEIFEHDILYDPIENNFFIVTYDENYANFFLKNIDESPDKPDYDFAEYETDVCNSLYVIGNIHENPELLNG